MDRGQSFVFSFPADQDVFQIGAVNGSVSVKKAVLDFEARSSFAVSVTVTDNGLPSLSTTVVLPIQLSNVNEAPVAVFDRMVLEVPENSANGTNVGALPVFDVDALDTLFTRLVVLKNTH